MVVFRVERQYSLFGWQFEFAVSEGTSKPMQIEEIRFTDQAGNALAWLRSLPILAGGSAARQWFRLCTGLRAYT
jgi:hypothetical protein